MISDHNSQLINQEDQLWSIRSQACEITRDKQRDSCFVT